MLPDPIRKRCGSHVAQMQAEIDGRKEAGQARPTRTAQRPSTEPAQSKRDDDAPLLFAIWNVNRGVAYVLMPIRRTDPVQTRATECTAGGRRSLWGSIPLA